MMPIIFIGVYIISFALFISTFGLRFSIPSLSDVYDVRAQYKEITEGNILTRYLVGWMGYVVNIFLLLYALQTKNLKLLIFSVVFQLYIFTLMALKSHLAAYILAALLFFVFKKYRTLSSFKFLAFTVIFILSLSFVDFITGNDLLEMLITRRIMVVPSQLTYYHFDFFEHRSKTYWAFSVFKDIFSYPYKLPPPNIIGEKHFGNEKMTAVVNLFIEGYTAFGYCGVVMVTLLLKELLKAIDYMFIKRSGRNMIIVIILLGLCNIINSTSIFTMLLTHGWFILILLITIFPWKVLKESS
ncbi:oligosaccharide repeat unit polymerase [Chryseobacterium sp. G0162]|uniref:oligosaccharide repeat unit polymerase n=1 Tax=Chryseobacterium sp. G0162 TaxID=2487063 RepID=UPI000F511747|nr:oligosaccharide repeat unit polymerase [Chryseobacterium sp. G0162]